MTIELIRHGNTLWQGTGRYQGRSDVPLSPEGMGELRPADFSPQVVYITPLQRTRQTAEILFPKAQLVEIPDLAEMDFGSFEGRSAQDMAQDPAYRAWVDGMCQGPCPGGESLDTFSRRVCRAFVQLVEGALAWGEDTLTVVAHGGTQMAVMAAYARPARSYFDWSLPCGQSYLLDASPWKETGTLTLLGTRDYTGGKG